MSFSLHLRELLTVYGLCAGGMLLGLLLMRADHRAYFRWPVYSAMVMALGVVLWNLLRRHALPQQANLMYALSLYFVLGLGAGLLLGRLTGRKTAQSVSRGANHGQVEEEEVEGKEIEADEVEADEVVKGENQEKGEVQVQDEHDPDDGDARQSGDHTAAQN
jgi:hypothetical protein